MQGWLAAFLFEVDIITSSQNQYVKLARSLSQKKHRLETGLILAEGINLLRDMPASVEVRYVFYTLDRRDEVLNLLEKYGIAEDDERVMCVTDSVLKSFADTVTPYGIAAVVKMPSLEYVAPTANAILLDGVADPGNVGTIIRTAAAAGFEDVYLLDCAEAYSPKVIRASLGGIFRIRVHEVDIMRAMELVREFDSAALDMDGQDLLKSELPSPVLLIAGSEAHGVRECIKNSAKHVYALPMSNGVESLNVAVAAAVAMYQTI